MTEKEKKHHLAVAISPHLTLTVGELAKMDSARLVPLVNLLLHDHDHDHSGSHDHSGYSGVAEKTEEQYVREFRKGLAKRTNQSPEMLRGVNSIVLGLINCQSKLLSNLHTALQGGQRDGRGFPGGANGTTNITNLLTNLLAGNMTELAALFGNVYL